MSQLAQWQLYGPQIEAFAELVEAAERGGLLTWHSLLKPRQFAAEHFEVELAELERERRALLDGRRARFHLSVNELLPNPWL